MAAGTLVVGALLAAAYVQTSEHDPGLTTETASLLAYLLGALAWRNPQAAAAAGVVVTVLLVSKRELHHFVRNVMIEVEVEDALKFFVAAFVVLPLLPNRPLGPYGVLNPHRIWVLVVSLTGIGWVGYVAVRMFGPRRGLPLAAFAAGFVSATATTLTMARTSRRSPDRFWPALVGALLASLATMVQLTAVLGIANPDVLARLGPGLAAGGAAILVEALLLARLAPASPTGDREPKPPSGAEARPSERPFALVPALVLAGMLTAVLLARAGAAILGAAGATLVAAVSGFADAHAPALAVATLARQGSVPVASAVIGCAAALATNTATKCALSFTAGGRRFGTRFCLGLLPPALAVSGVLLS